MQVLVAESSSNVCEMIRLSLQEIGVQRIHEAKTAEEAIRSFGNSQFDMVLVEWEMRTTSGAVVVEEIRKLDKDVTIIAITTQSENVSALEAKQTGISDYLVKPFMAQILREKLATFVPARTE